MCGQGGIVAIFGKLTGQCTGLHWSLVNTLGQEWQFGNFGNIGNVPRQVS